VAVVGHARHGGGGVSVSITAMADVREDIAGVASGLMTTGHETGAALGVAVLSAIASAVAMSGPSQAATGRASGPRR